MVHAPRPAAIGAELATALAAAQKSIKAVEKSAENKHHRYHYASAEQMIEEARGALGEHGLSFVALRCSITNGVLNTTYALIHTSGQWLEVQSSTPIVEANRQPADKAAATAKTYDLAYTLRSTLNMPRAEEGQQPDARNDRDVKPEPKPKSAPQWVRDAQDSFRKLADAQDDLEVWVADRLNPALAKQGLMQCEGGKDVQHFILSGIPEIGRDRVKAIFGEVSA